MNCVAILFLWLLSLIALISTRETIPVDHDLFRIGAAKQDITGPAAEVGMMGYAMLNQRTHGIHFRTFARAIVISSKLNNNYIAIVNVDLCMNDQAVKMIVAERIANHPVLKHYYGLDNIVITATHTHSTPGGLSWYTMYDITTLGFEFKNFELVVNGIIKAIERAHSNMSNGGRILINEGILLNSNINRSPTAYLMNPESERIKYKDMGDTDKNMVLLRFENENGMPVAMLNWFAVHGTSMNNTNQYISGDNKGFAAYMFEYTMNKNNLNGSFVAIFAQTNEGDVSPNTRGPTCPDGITPCAPDSTCEGKTQLCTGKGPGKDQFESCKIIGRNQFEKAYELFTRTDKSRVVRGPIEFRHTYVDFFSVDIDPKYLNLAGGNLTSGTTCRAAMGYSFAAGTTDGPGEFNFKQGDNDTAGNPFWNFLSSFIAEPTEEQKKCQYPKPILLDVGMTKPYPWCADVLPIQLFTVGSLVMLNVPSEMTTMSGRRIREYIYKTLTRLNPVEFPANETKIVINGLSNAYSGYTTTFEEYIMQRYEGASTMYGPHTLSAYVQEFDKLAIAIATKKPVPPGPTPVNHLKDVISFNPGVILDLPPLGKDFGSVHEDVDKSRVYRPGDLVKVSFWSGHPKNDFMTDKSFLTIEKQMQDGSWKVILTDADWDTRFRWTRVSIFLPAESLAIVEWYIGETIPVTSGTYRIQHFGVAKHLTGLRHYSGVSSSFTIRV
jgi:neutral ceramidase